MISSLNDILPISVYLKRIGAETRSLRTAVVREMHGAYWKDVAIIRFSENGTIDAPLDYEPTESESAAIMDACKDVTWPKLKLVKRPVDIPPEIANADAEDLFEFRNENDELVMFQLRKVKRGEKSYIPYTYWSDGIWRKMEPDGKLPLWGLDKIKDNTTVFIHEGAKAARYVAWMVNAETKAAKDALAACPWGDELSGASHVGWIGGALSPSRTDWSALKRAGVKRAYIVSDNDPAGLSAVPGIAQNLRIVTFHVQFTSDWSPSFDLADAWPAKMFKMIEGSRHYIGPSFRSCLNPSTWATDLKPNKKGKPTPTLRDHFKELWAYVEEADLFVCTEMPEIVRSEQILNKMLGAFSHVSETSRLIVKDYNGRTTRLCYRPDHNGRVIINKNTASINLHIPTTVKPKKGNIKPFLDFMGYMFPNPIECKEMLRWCATLIAHPEVRMEYGVLLVSETQGVGKTTLGSSILAQLVGENNVSWPGENDITNSDFNGWLAHKRLAIVNEIYSGHSWKAYNRLKNYITDKDVAVNQKFQRSYTIENWCHVFACSNSLRALKMEDDDRRWFYPEVTENKWSRDKFVELHAWLEGGGLSIILNWCREQGDWVRVGERAPMTGRKADLIEGSRTEAQKEASDLANAMTNFEGPAAVAMKDVEQWVKQSVKGKVFDSDYDLRKAMKESGVVSLKKRMFIDKRLQYVMVNRKLYEQTLRLEQEEVLPMVLKSIKRANELLQVSM